MNVRDLTIVDEDNRRAMIVRHGSVWAVLCITEQACPPIVGYMRRYAAIMGAEAHLRWHANGKPTCGNCGRPLPQKNSKRCRKGTCEVDR